MGQTHYTGENGLRRAKRGFLSATADEFLERRQGLSQTEKRPLVAAGFDQKLKLKTRRSIDLQRFIFRRCFLSSLSPDCY
jgi:hypothetical protein